VVEGATRDLVAMDFGLTGYDEAECRELFEMLRPLRIAAGDFSPVTESAAVADPV
jgi:hypothetical protein